MLSENLCDFCLTSLNFYEKAAEIAKQIDPKWKWRKQELMTLYNRLKKSEISVSNEKITRNEKSILLPKIYIL